MNDNIFLKTITLKGWFKRSGADIKRNIRNIPEINGGLLMALANFPEEGDNMSLWRVKNILLGKSLSLVELVYKSTETNEEFTREAVISNQGDGPFSYGLVLLTEKEIPKFFVLAKQKSINGGIGDWKAIELYFPDFSKDKPIVLPEKYQKDLEKVLGGEFEINKFIDLGQIYLNEKVFLNQSNLFVTTIEMRGQINENINLKQLVIVPVDKKSELRRKTKSGTILAILAKMEAFGIL
jgi:hypothetical protein